MSELFRRLACWAAEALGSPAAFVLAAAAILASGALAGYSDRWVALLSAVVAVCALLMMMLLQGTANRHAKALHLKLDELLRSDSTARNAIIGAQDLPDAELIEAQAELLAAKECET